jgi:hypothetical protein
MADQAEREAAPAGCPHLAQIRDVAPRTDGCEECLATGDEWVALSLCLTCGHVGCCWDSKGQHAWRHFYPPILPTDLPRIAL